MGNNRKGSSMDVTRRSHGRGHGPRWLWALIGAGLGAAVGAAIYLLAVPALENSAGVIREMQGLLWNTVPLLTVGGAIAGWAGWARPRRAEPQEPE